MESSSTNVISEQDEELYRNLEKIFEKPYCNLNKLFRPEDFAKHRNSQKNFLGAFDK